MKRIGFLLTLGLLPVAAGSLYDLVISFLPVSVLIINLLFLLLWGILHYKVCRPGEALVKLLLCTHAIPLLCGVLVLVQELTIGGFWLNGVGFVSQICFLPVLSLGVLLAGPLTGAYTVSSGAIGGLFLMLLCAIGFCLLNRWLKAKP